MGSPNILLPFIPGSANCSCSISLFTTTVPKSNIGSAETTLYSASLLGNVINNTNSISNIIFSGSVAGANTIKVYLGANGNNTDTLILEIQPTAAWVVNISLLTQSSTEIVASATSSDTAVSKVTSVTPLNLGLTNYVTITGQSTVSNNVTLLSGSGVYLGNA